MDSGLILLVDDNPDDVECVRRACTRLGVINTIHDVSDADQAMTYLTAGGIYSNRHEHPLPTLVLLDISMPGCNGFELLELIRKDKQLSHIVVVLLTGNDSPEIRKQGLQLGAAAFLPKTSSVELFSSLLLNLNARILVPFHPEAIIHFARPNPEAVPKIADGNPPPP